jgi:hypothetical protein
MTGTAAPRHIHEGELVRLIQGELGDADRAAASAHLAACERCAARLAALAQRLASAEEAIGQVTPALEPARRAQAWAEVQRAALRRRQKPAARRWTGLARAAAVGAAFFAAAFAAEPVRAWVSEAWGSFFGAPAEIATLEPVSAPLRVRNSVIGFAPTARDFSLELRSRQTTGVLRLTITPASTAATARIIGADEMSVAVLPGGLRIDNDAGFSTDYEVVVPATLRTLVVRVADSTALELDVAGLELPWSAVIDLADAATLPDATHITD